jgi:hypothetical protein
MIKYKELTRKSVLTLYISVTMAVSQIFGMNAKIKGAKKLIIRLLVNSRMVKYKITTVRLVHTALRKVVARAGSLKKPIRKYPRIECIGYPGGWVTPSWKACNASSAESLHPMSVVCVLK